MNTKKLAPGQIERARAKAERLARALLEKERALAAEDDAYCQRQADAMAAVARTERELGQAAWSFNDAKRHLLVCNEDVREAQGALDRANQCAIEADALVWKRHEARDTAAASAKAAALILDAIRPTAAEVKLAAEIEKLRRRIREHAEIYGEALRSPLEGLDRAVSEGPGWEQDVLLVNPDGSEGSRAEPEVGP